MAGATAPGASKRRFWLVVVLVGYALLRLLLVPVESTVGGFSHDSAYIALLAENLVAGNGYINDALWLVFLDPPALPMPFHNANPLYPTLTATLSWITGKSVIWAGFALTATAHAVLIGTLVSLLRPWISAYTPRIMLATLAAFFPPIFESSLVYLPDLVGLVFVLAAVACLVRLEQPLGSILAGVFMGLAWLTRSSEIFALPMIAVFLLFRDGWRGALLRLTLLGMMALVVALPWLLHTASVWGNPFRSDTTYYWLQDYYARGHHGSIARYWHSPEPPPTLRTLLSREPAGFLSFYIGGAFLFVPHAVAGWSDKHVLIAIILALLGFVAGIRLLARIATHPNTIAPVIALVTLAVTLWLGLAPRRARSRFAICHFCQSPSRC